MLIDDVKIKISAGDGGMSGVSFNTDLKSLGPNGVSDGNDAAALEKIKNILNKIQLKK